MVGPLDSKYRDVARKLKACGFVFDLQLSEPGARWGLETGPPSPVSVNGFRARCAPSFQGDALADNGGLHAKELDQHGKSSGLLPATGIVEEISRKWLAPLVKHSHKSATCQM